MAEALLTFAATELLKKVAILAGEEFSLVWGFKEELARMRSSSVKLEAMLEAAENLTKDLGENVKIWVKEIEGIAGDADDLLDDFGYEVLRRKVEKKKVSSLFDTLVFRHKMGRKIKKINESLASLEKQAASFHLVIAGNARSVDLGVLDRQTVFCFDEDEKNIIGRDEVLSDLVTTLISSNNNQDLSVLPIVGMAGLGKTTVAKSLYNDDEIGRHFQQKIWICVSTTFDVEKILSGILGYLNAEKAAVRGKAAILKHIQEELGGKKYFLVLDDVWNEDLQKWDDLRTCLSSVRGTDGSSIIVTTRNIKIAEIMETLPRCDMGKLSHDECWLILKNKAIPVGSILPEHQERIGKEIAKKCGGVPLVAKVLGSLMRSKNSNEWLGIENSRIWDLTEESHRIFAVLKLSFSELKPPSLKKCFAYCAMFEEDFNMEKDDLIQLWMAMGLLESPSHEGNREEMECIGSAYYNTLLGNSLFQDVTRDKYGTITHCKMHDLVHDLAKHVSKSMDLTRYCNKIQHVQHNQSSLPQRLPNEALVQILPEFKTLRVLKLYEANISELPDSIGKLKYLRYLDVSRTEIKALPKSIGKLYNLQTLRMHRLFNLERLPTELQKLINLRHIYFDRTIQFPVGLGKLTNLRTLTRFPVGKEIGRGIEELAGLSKLTGELTISYLEHVKDGEEAKKANLVGKTNIRKLRFQWSQQEDQSSSDSDEDVLEDQSSSDSDEDVLEDQSSSNRDEDVLEGLQPHSNLQFLEIHKFKGERFPSWIMSRSFPLNNLKEIEFANCNTCERLPMLGHLPHLVHLRIDTMRNLKFVGSEFYGYDNIVAMTGETTKTLFPALKTLSIVRANKLIEWMEAPVLPKVRVFPCLEELTLRGCSQLQSAPNHFPSLQRLDIEFMDSGIPIASILSTHLTTLTYLHIRDIKGLDHLPEKMLENNKNLACLEILHCYELTNLAPHEFKHRCSSLQSLYICRCDTLKYLPDGLLTHSLKKLSLVGCDSLESIPDITDGLTSLETLTIYRCSKIMSIPITSKGLPSLQKLEIEKCPELSSLPSGLEYCTSIRSLTVTECPKVTSISIQSMSTSLQELCVSNLEFLSTLHGGFSSLRHLSIEGSTSPYIGMEFWPSLQILVTLQELSVGHCDNLDTVPSLDNLTSLVKLSISHCSRLTCLPSLASLTCLKELSIGLFWEELESFPDFQVIPQLESLTLWGWPLLKSLPEQIQHFTSLTHLRISCFDGLEAFPEWLGNLTTLEYLDILGCDNMTYLPSVRAMQRLTKLKSILISGCPLLRERCTEESGPERPKISHIPQITVL